MVHDGGFSEQERIRYRRHIAGNAVKCMRCVSAVLTLLSFHCALCAEYTRTCRSFLEIVRNLDLTLAHRSERYVGVILAESDYMPDEDEDADPSSTVLHALRTLRRDPVIEVLLQRSSELLDDSIPFYLSFIDRLATPNYLPTDEEIIAVRMRTPMFETSFRAGEVTYRVVDFSVQRSDRRKWIHCFEGVEAVLFFASLNGYDEMLSEGNTNIVSGFTAPYVGLSDDSYISEPPRGSDGAVWVDLQLKVVYKDGAGTFSPFCLSLIVALTHFPRSSCSRNPITSPRSSSPRH